MVLFWKYFSFTIQCVKEQNQWYWRERWNSDFVYEELSVQIYEIHLQQEVKMKI